jgi:hypothetical protein
MLATPDAEIKRSRAPVPEGKKHETLFIKNK